MLSTAAKTATPGPCQVVNLSSGHTQDAHRSFIDLFEDGAPRPATSAAAPAAQTTATVPGDSRSQGGDRESTATDAASKSFQGAVASVRRGLLGRNKPFRTPYGMKPLVYSDWTATGRAVASIETYLADQVVPLFGNTHTTTSITGAQTSCFRHEARQIIAQAVNAKVTGRAAEDVVLFTGTGATAAVAKLVSALGLAAPLPPGWNPDDRPVIFVGPLEHHSNLLPWRESCGEVVTVRENPSSGGVDLAHLEEQLRRFASRRLKIGAFSAASNVTGLLEDVDKVTATLHRAGALALWDYATAAPYVHVDMNPSASGLEDDQALVAKDAIFFSGHKFVGGPGTPGVLVVKKRLLCNAVPGTVGGGTVFFVTEKDHRYLSNKEEREEGGTPDILGSIRLGLAVQMKESMGRRGLQEREEALAELGLSTLRAHKGIVVLGDSGKKRLPIFSFLVRTASSSGRFLHHNFVCALLNDLFGVQSRGGCQCAGPYSQLLLGLSLPDTRAVEAELLRKHELLRPGFSRLSLSFVNSDGEAKYILDAVLFVADHGASFLPYYRVNYKTGEWKHKTRFTRFPERRWLGNCDYGFAPRRGTASDGSGVAVTLTVTPKRPSAAATEEEEGELEGEAAREREAEMEMEMEGVLEDAERHLKEAEARVGEERWQGSDDVLGPEGEALRWFLYPWEGSNGGVPFSAGDATIPKSGGCIVKPKVYGGEPTDAAAGATVSGASLEEDGGRSGEDVATAATLVAARVGQENGRKAAAQSDPVFVEAAAAAERGTGVVPPPPHEGGTSGSGDGDAAAAVGGGVEPVPPRPSPPGGDGEEQLAEDESAATVAATAAAAAAAAAASAAGNDNDDAAPSRTDIGGDSNRAKHRNRQPDDSHKYPLRQANRDSGGGQTGGLSLAAETPAFLASSPAANGTGSVAGGTGSGGGENGSVPHGANGEGVESGGGKLKGYEGHMSALGKLGAGSAESRLFPTPGKKIMRAVGQAVQAWRMIEDGDRLCLGLSGGKDSMTLLHVLLHLQKRAPITFEVACATVDPQTPSFDPSPLIPYLERLGVKLHYISSPIIEQAKTSMQGDSLCAFCARMKRGLLYACCREQGYNKLVLAQHLDDLAESFIMSALHNGQVRTMKANYKIEAGDVRVIRPLCYAREALTKDFARTNRLPLVNENCPACFEEPKERHRVKKMLAKEESLFPSMYANLRKALVPLMDDEVYASMDKTSSEVAARQLERRSRPPTRRKKGDQAGGRNPGDAAESSRLTAPTMAVASTETRKAGDGATAAPDRTAAAALEEDSGVQGTAGTDDIGEGRRGTAACLAEFSDESLEQELARRRSGVDGDDAVGADARGVCEQKNGGVCVPCFEIV